MIGIYNPLVVVEVQDVGVVEVGIALVFANIVVALGQPGLLRRSQCSPQSWWPYGLLADKEGFPRSGEEPTATSGWTAHRNRSWTGWSRLGLCTRLGTCACLTRSCGWTLITIECAGFTSRVVI